SDLELSRGKLAVQVAHAAVMAAFEARTHHRKWFADWWAEGQKKVVVKGGTVGDLQALRNRARSVGLTAALVEDAGLTELPPGIVAGSRYRAGLAMILIDGTAVGGFNVIDVDSLHERVDRPVVTVTRRKPDLAAIETALRRRFDDWEDRLRLMRRHRVESIRLGQGSLWISYVGTDREAVGEALRLTTVRGVLPEPLRIAHLIAAGIVRGESRGRASGPLP